MTIHELTTDRLRLRAWTSADLEPFAALNADPEVMRYFPAVLTREESDAFAAAIMTRMDQRGFGLWAVETAGTRDFIGFVGLAMPTWEAHFMPCVEVGWRLARRFWNQGYATEAARAALAFGFDHAKLPEIVSFTSLQNTPSRRVMEKLGMTTNPADDFDHPRIAEGHPLRRHVLYRKRP